MLNVLNLYLQVHGGDRAVKFWIFSRLHCKSVFESRTAMQWYIFMSIFYLKLSDSQSTFNFRVFKENRSDQDDKHMQIFPGFLLKIVMLQPITAPVKVICRVSHFIFFLQESWAFLWKGKAHQLDSKYLFKYNYTKNIFVVKKNKRSLSCFLFFLRHILFSSILMMVTLHLHSIL